MRTNYILVDYENVQPCGLTNLKGVPFKVVVFVGANQCKIPFEFASSLQALGDNAEYVKISGNGRNALDFHIAFYIGQLTERDPAGCFHIISRDTGFDLLIEHLRAKNILIHRRSDLIDVPIVRQLAATTTDDKIEMIVKSLCSRGQARPRKVKTLVNTISALFMRTLDESELSALVEELGRRGYISVHQDNISYKLPNSQPRYSPTTISVDVPLEVR